MTTTETLKQMLDVFTGSVAALERLGWTGNDEYRAEAEKRKREVAALTDALRALEQEPKLKAEIERLTKVAADCYRESGEDPDGNTDDVLAIHAVHAVRVSRLENEKEAERLEAEVMRLRAEVAKLKPELADWRGNATFLQAHGIAVPEP